MTAKTLYRKLVESHTVGQLDAQDVLLFCDPHLMNECTSPQAFAGLYEQGHGVSRATDKLRIVAHQVRSSPAASQTRPHHCDHVGIARARAQQALTTSPLRAT
jgi:3-isopropylmalate/(R)-2-methylmalate dehydratase large subunit